MAFFLCSIFFSWHSQAELLPKENPKIQQQLNYANASNIPFAIIFGASEIANNTLNFKNLFTSEQITIPRAELVSGVQRAIADFYAKGGLSAAVAVRAKREVEGAGKHEGKDGSKKEEQKWEGGLHKEKERVVCNETKKKNKQ